MIAIALVLFFVIVLAIVVAKWITNDQPRRKRSPPWRWWEDA